MTEYSPRIKEKAKNLANKLNTEKVEYEVKIIIPYASKENELIHQILFRDWLEEKGEDFFKNWLLNKSASITQTEIFPS